ncbi:MAG: carboxypeptidase-like regulatory domain-containing protein [Deltaproteobacteria bacterium]|nr:carboxypeptidase-like regulatory domain-containing protein [Deltaproteobacteria bacterium]
MNATRWRWLGLVAAVLAVAAALWVTSGKRRSRPAPQDPASVARKPSARSTQPATTTRSPGGVIRREPTVEGEGAVQGRVVDQDGQPATEGQLVLWCLGSDGQVARIHDGVVTLDQEGRFSGPGCRGRVCPRLRHPFLVPASPWSMRAGTEITLEARTLPRLWGRVVDPQGNAVAGAQVVITAGADDDPTAVLPVVTSATSTDADGIFSVARIERPPCDPCQEAGPGCPDELLPVLDQVEVIARAAGWAPGSRTVDVAEARDLESAAVVAVSAPGAAITGRLVDAEGQPLPRAVVLARSQLRSHEQHQTRAPDGEFSFDTLADGPYTVRAIQDGRELTRQLDVEPGTDVELRLVERQRDVELVVVNAEGSPRADVQVEGGPFARQRTDAGGRVRATRAIPGTYILRVTPPGASVRAHDLRIPPLPKLDPADVALTLTLPEAD